MSIKNAHDNRLWAHTAQGIWPKGLVSLPPSSGHLDVSVRPIFTFASDIRARVVAWRLSRVVRVRLVAFCAREAVCGHAAAVVPCCLADVGCAGDGAVPGGLGRACGEGGEGLAAALAGSRGRPLAARRAFSSWRAFQVRRMRWLRTTSSTAVNSMRGVSQEAERQTPDRMVSARLTCGQLPAQTPFAQVSPKREDLTLDRRPVPGLESVFIICVQQQSTAVRQGSRPRELGYLTPIYNRSGRVCAWLLDQTIRDLRGHVTAFISGSELVGTGGHHLGRFRDGNIRDHKGAVVGWVKGATGGPKKPFPTLPPFPPRPAFAPRPPFPPRSPMPAKPSMAWSTMTWQQFIEQ